MKLLPSCPYQHLDLPIRMTETLDGLVFHLVFPLCNHEQNMETFQTGRQQQLFYLLITNPWNRQEEHKYVNITIEVTHNSKIVSVHIYFQELIPSKHRITGEIQPIKYGKIAKTLFCFAIPYINFTIAITGWMIIRHLFQ